MLAPLEGTSVELVLENNKQKITMKGKTKGVSTDISRDYQDITSDWSMDSFRYLDSEEYKTNIDWLGPYEMTVVDKTFKGYKSPAKVYVKLRDGDYETYEARAGALRFDIYDAMVYVYQVEIGCEDVLLGIVNEGWVSVSYA